MTFPALSPEEVEESRKQDAIADAKIAACKLEVDRLKSEALGPIFRSTIIPRPLNTWFSSRATNAAIQAAQENYEWAIYDRSRAKRPLYPRKRALSNLNLGGDLKFNVQSQSLFFSRLPGEIRKAVYRVLLTGFRFEIKSQHGWPRGPKGIEGRFVFTQCTMEDEFGRVNQCMLRMLQAPRIAADVDVLPLLQSCRRVYIEAIDMLYQENIFCHMRHFQIPYLTKYLLKQRLESIQHFECLLEIGYPWHVMHIPLEALAKMCGLKKLKIEGLSEGMVDGQDHEDPIDKALWRERKHLILPYLRKLAGMEIREVDVYLPISERDLSEEDGFGRFRIRGWEGRQKNTLITS